MKSSLSAGTFGLFIARVVGALFMMVFSVTVTAEEAQQSQTISFHADAAVPPVEAPDMETVLRRDLDQALTCGELGPETSTGIAVGVVRKGTRRVFAFGTAKPDALFEIASITKTFTGLVLAQMIEQGTLRMDEPVHEWLPSSIAAPPPGKEILLLDLVTHHSGLPRMPDDYVPSDEVNHYAEYGLDRLYSFLKRRGLEKPIDAKFLYSNLGMSLLGQAMANRSGHSYAELVKTLIADPLDMPDTTITLSSEQSQRFIQGHTANHKPTAPWDLNAFAAAGGIRSTASDMLTYLEAQLHPEKIAVRNSNSRTLGAAIRRSHLLQSAAPLSANSPRNQIAFAWMYNPDFVQGYWHNGSTGGFTSMAFFNPQEDYAAVVLVNNAITSRWSIADALAQHIAERFAGRSAISFTNGNRCRVIEKK